MKHTVQLKLRAAYWKYIEDVVTLTNSTTDEAHTSNKRFWSLLTGTAQGVGLGGGGVGFGGFSHPTFLAD